MLKSLSLRNKGCKSDSCCIYILFLHPVLGNYYYYYITIIHIKFAIFKKLRIFESWQKLLKFTHEIQNFFFISSPFNFHKLFNGIVCNEKIDQLKPINDYSTENISIHSSKATNAIITFINDETINTKIQALKNIDGSMDPSTVTSFIVIYDKNGKRNFIRNSVIKKMIITDYSKNNRTFINRKNYPNSLQELIYNGKIKWFIEYKTNMYDYSTQTINYFINENEQEIIITPLNNIKNKLKEITKSKPELSGQIETMNTDRESILELLKEYEKLS